MLLHSNYKVYDNSQKKINVIRSIIILMVYSNYIDFVISVMPEPFSFACHEIYLWWLPRTHRVVD